MTTLEQVLELIPTLTPGERRQVLEVLVADPETAQRAVVAQLDARLAADDDADDSWWNDFAQAIDADRTSARPLYPESSQQPR
ncbi:MAG: hypothetical protein MUD01_11120 [Chloroflexaceae bacterium]|jgi:hypothetical protein|nr:hypothetical protein [Chloroflexaceae bacterium]